MTISSDFINGQFGWAHYLILLVVIQRLAELIYANHNTKRLLASGGYETGRDHYVLFILLHSTWLATLLFLTPANPEFNTVLIFSFVLLQLGRLWVILTLGQFWTTRIITVPNAPLVKHGPYKFIKHPNYFIVAFEIPLLPLALGMPLTAAIFGLANLALLYYRISIENKELDKRIHLSS